MGLLAGTPKCVFSMRWGFLTTWWLDSNGKCLQRERERERARGKQKPFWNLVLEAPQGHFCHTLFVRRESLNPPQVQGKGN